MASTFFGLTIAGSGLSAYQTAINTTANNISNVQTDGYSKQVANRQSSNSLRVNARYGSTGTGVTTTAIKQLRNEYYDQKYWENQTNLGYYSEKLYYMSQIESYYTDDDNTTGFSSLLSKMFNNLDSVGASAADETVRKSFISSAQSLSAYFNNVSQELQSLQSSCNDEVKSTVDNINNIAQKVALLNKQINAIEVEGGYANELRDQRALLVDELSEIVPVQVSESQVVNSNYPEMYTGATNYSIKINGQSLVDTYDYRTLTCTARTNKVNQTDVEGLYDITWSDLGTEFNGASNAMSGTLKGLLEMRDGNNGKNFTGTVSDFNLVDNTVTFSGADLSITSVDELNMPISGKITINNKNYNYSGFSYTTEIDADGNEKIKSFTFDLEDDITSADAKNLASKKGSVGQSINSMGIPYYMNQMNSFLRSFCKKFNNLEETGQDLNGDDMGAFFVANGANGEFDFSDYADARDGYDEANDTTKTKTYSFNMGGSGTNSDSYYLLTAANFAVAGESITDPSRFSTTASIADGTEASEIVDELAKLYDETTIYRGCKAKDFLQCILDDVSVDTEEATTFKENYTSIQSAISIQRQSISGVDEDEEAMDLIKFQNAYNLSSKVISIMTEMYDQLILNTGV